MDPVNSYKGLIDSEVLRSREQYGSNHLVKHKKKGFFSELLANFGDPIIKILLVALVVNIVIMIKDFNWFETIGIAAAILVSTIVSTISEYGSESAFEKLQNEAMETKCRVIRNGKVNEIMVCDVVVGDIILLQAGERIPADGLIIDGSIYADQSPLNGESKEVFKEPLSGKQPDTMSLSDKNCLLRGCVVSSGEGVMKVKAVGNSTFYGKLALDIQEETGESPLKIRLAQLAGSISKLGYTGAALVAAADVFNSVLIKNNFDKALIIDAINSPREILTYFIHAATLAISVIVVAIPEGLPLMITVVLSSNMKRMLRDNVLVRKLVGIETSGNVNVLFTDKTGTITRGHLEVVSFTDGTGKNHSRSSSFLRSGLGQILKDSIFYNNGAAIQEDGKSKKAIGGNYTDRALLEYICNDSKADKNVSIVGTVPFNSKDKFSCARIKGRKYITLIKGAPEIILPGCNSYFDADGNKKMGNFDRLKKSMNEMTGKAIRLIMLAVSDGPVSAKKDFRNLTLVGVIGIRDEIRPEAHKAITQVMRAGIQVVMMTGDNRETASAIAEEVGLIHKGQKYAVITSDELNQLDDDELSRRLPDIRVISRALPSDKSRLIKISQKIGLVAGMTGDGINDAPALKIADVGFAMGSGTEVAKEASDIIILDDNFTSIGKAVLYGRTIFKSIRKFIIFQLTINMCAVGISIIGPFIGVNSPITVLQMLWINMVMDTLAALAFAGEPPLLEYMEEQPKKKSEPIINKYMLHQILLSGGYITGLCIFFLKSPLIWNAFGDSEIDFMSGFFAMFVFACVFNAFNTRTIRIKLWSYIIRNKAFIYIMTFVFVVQLLMIYFGGSVFRTTDLSAKELQLVFMLSFTVIPADIIRKIIIIKHRKNMTL